MNWNHLERAGMSWNHLERAGTSSNQLEQAKTSTIKIDSSQLQWNNVFFCFCCKNRSCGGINLIFFPEPANFSASPRSRKSFLTHPEGSGKIKNVNFIKSAEKRDGTKRKQQPISFDLCRILFKLVSMDVELNSALGNERYFYPRIGCGTKKSSQT